MSAIPPNVVFMWGSTNASIPTNWTEEITIANRFIKGYGAENPGITGGAITHSHTGIAHSHTETDTHGHWVQLSSASTGESHISGTNTDGMANDPHYHVNAIIAGISGGTASDTIPYPGITDNNAPPHSRLIFIKAGAGAVFAVDMIGLWNSATPPGTWYHCDGSNSTIDLRDRFPRGVASGGNSNTGLAGADTHTHVLSHSHTTSHTHFGPSGAPDATHNCSNAGGSGCNKLNSHTHNVTLNAQTVVTDIYSATLTSGAIEPPFKKLLAVQRKGGSTNPRGLIGIWLSSVATIPSGWLACTGQVWEDGVTYTPDMQNYYLKFANTTGEIGNTTQAGITIATSHLHAVSNLHSHSQAGAHTHTGSAEYLNASGGTPCGGCGSSNGHAHNLASVGNNTATLTWSSSTMSAESQSNEPQYIRAAFIQLTRPKTGILTIL